MIGMLATLCVVLQMAIMSFGIDVRIAMSIGLVGCALWMYHARKHKDNWLFTTNAVVAMFAIYGLV